jgi:hypothetical protein
MNDEEANQRIIKELEKQTEELHSIGANVSIVTWIIGTATVMIVLEFIHQQYHWF